jgi:fructose-1,6-bisphosphatase/inositol monophosphatase family enzyme
MKKQLIQIINGAIQIIRNEAATFAVQAKENDFKNDDVVTSADYKAQNYYEEELTRTFPDFGIIGEEGLNKVAEDYFTVDPLDGTKAYSRKKATGVSTMLAAVQGGEVVAAFVGDANCEDIYGYTPEDETAFRIRFGVAVPMVLNPQELRKQYVVLHDNFSNQIPVIQKIVQPPELGGCFKNFEVMGGSIGTLCARLWMGEVGAIVIGANNETPWDSTPIIGINKKMGIVQIKVDRETGKAEIHNPVLVKEVVAKSYDEILVHESNAEQVVDFINGDY